MLSRLRIRGKIVVLLVIPLLAVVAIIVPVVLNSVREASRASDTAEKARVGSRIGALLQDLQTERLLATGFGFELVDKARLGRQNQVVDAKLAELRGDTTLTLTAEVSGAIGTPDLATLRGAVLTDGLSADVVITRYSAIITKIIASLHLERGLDLDTSEGRQVIALNAALYTDDALTNAACYLVVAAATKDHAVPGGWYAGLNSLQLWIQRFTAFATPQQTKLYSQVQTEATKRLGSGFSSGLNTPGGIDIGKALTGVPVGLAFSAVQSIVGTGQAIENRIASDVNAAAADARQQAYTVVYVVLGGFLLVLLVVMLLSTFIARTVVRPLTRLTTSAGRVALLGEQELTRVADDESDAPAPIHLEAVDVRARDEIGDLARAFERVQTTATALVERQVASRRNVAQMFGHVGRRTQNLVSRQLSLIDRLERQETDTERLQQLYRLDHISSRLRRNAGSLVVLSGSAGVDEQVSPVPLADIVRLALGEIEEYTRVDVEVPGDIAVAPAGVNDLILVLAELMENATIFSPPHVRVTVSAQQQGYGIVLTVLDHGIGLSEERIAQENARLERRERLDLAPTEVLGLFVVGRLARRHDLRVTLSTTPGGGVTATLLLGPHIAHTGLGAGQPRAAEEPTQLLATHGAHTAHIPRVVEEPALAAGEPLYFDESAVSRASRSIATARPWSAFAAPQQRTAEEERTVPVPRVVPQQRTSPEPRTAPAPALEWPPRPQTPPQTPPEPDPPAAPSAPSAPSAPFKAPLRQRVPGAHAAPTTAPPANAPPPGPGDADAARALVEQFESGVQRAQRRKPTAPLTRRDPGVTLEALRGSGGTGYGTGNPAPEQPPPDPAQVRDLVEQFEAGVYRALRDVRADHQDEEGSGR